MKNLFNYLVEHFGSVNDAVEYVRTLYPKYPETPVKPRLLTIKSTPAEHRKYADELEKFNELMVTFRQEKDEYHKKVNEINAELEKYIKEMAGMNSVPEKYHAKLWSKAWEDGHANGYTEVYNELCELVDIFS